MDDLVFADEVVVVPVATLPPWRILVVDDDADVHSTTLFALGNVEMQGRPLTFLHAYSATEAFAVLGRERNIAVILLDVVMERADAGLQLVRRIRDELGLHDVRIILRTGQPGYAPEMEAIRGYDINDYRTKSELTRTKLYTTVAAAIRSYDQLCALEANRIGMECIVAACAQLMALHGVRDVAYGILTQAGKLIGQPPDGVLCTREFGDGTGASAFGPLGVVAACGASRDLEGCELDAQYDDPHVTRLAQAAGRTLARRACTAEDGVLALFFPGKAGRDFVACIPLGRTISDVEIRLLKVFCGMVAVSLDNCELVTDLHKSAFHDPLTGLPNRTRMVELIDAKLVAGSRTGSGSGSGLDHADDAVLALVDIDHFAETNDALGHRFGDLLLAAVAQRLCTRLAPGLAPALSIGRIGGDIFCVLGNAPLVQPALLQALFLEAFHIDGQDVQVSSTLGLVRLAEHDGSGADALKDADIALKRAKMQQRAGHCYFSRGMGVEIRERVRMMHALRSGFRNGELFLAYQPQIDLGTNRAFGAEALLRWRQQDGQLVSPDRFIPIAEYSGLIVEIGEWVLHQACMELLRLRAAGHTAFTMSVSFGSSYRRKKHIPTVFFAERDGRFEFMWSPPVGLVA